MVGNSTKENKEELAVGTETADSMQQSIVNRKYKDTIFRKLFHGKKELLELYNALNDSAYTNEEELEIVTLESCLYIGIRNDLAFVLDFRLHLYEHQSTPSPNMPLRDLFYVAQEYRTIVDKKSLFSERPIELPAPRFVVFYNGIEKQPERQWLKLSDLYRPKEAEPMLELQVLVLNINQGNNEWLKEKCRTLSEYMQYVDRIRYYKNEVKMPLQQAVERAVEECIREGILAEFLSRDKAEAIMFSMYEHSEEEEWRKFREAEREYGIELGRELGREEGLEEGKKAKQEQLIQNLMQNVKVSEEEARKMLGIGDGNSELVV